MPPENSTTPSAREPKTPLRKTTTPSSHRPETRSTSALTAGPSQDTKLPASKPPVKTIKRSDGTLPADALRTNLNAVDASDDLDTVAEFRLVRYMGNDELVVYKVPRTVGHALALFLADDRMEQQQDKQSKNDEPSFLALDERLVRMFLRRIGLEDVIKENDRKRNEEIRQRAKAVEKEAERAGDKRRRDSEDDSGEEGQQAKKRYKALFDYR